MLDSKLYEKALKDVSDYVAITNTEGVVVYCNSTAELITGYISTEIVGYKADNYWKKSEHLDLLERVLLQEAAYKGEITSIRKNGEEYISNTTIRPIVNDKGVKTAYIVIAHDINEEKVAEEQINAVLNDLQERSQILNLEKLKYESLLVNIGDGIIATDQDGNITTINRAAEMMLGWVHKDIEGKPITEAIKFVNEKGEIIPLYKTPTVLALSTGEKVEIPITTAYYLVRKDGSSFAVGLAATPYIFGNKIIGTIMIFRDVTIERNIDQAKSEFVSLASHQLRTPLTAISWYTEMLIEEVSDVLSKTQKEMLETIASSNQRMLVMVNALLNVSRLELGTFIIEPEPVDMIATANDVIKELTVTIKEKKLKVNCDFKKTTYVLNADPRLLRMIFQNLLSNAVKYTPEKGEIAVHINQLKGHYLVEVKDNGYGIPEHNQAAIFSKLFRADNVKKKQVEGTGLGLYIVKQIIDNAGGKIWFTSKEGVGTTFSFTLPLSGMLRREGMKSLS